MLQETIEPAWVDAFEAVLVRCGPRPGDTVAVLAQLALALRAAGSVNGTLVLAEGDVTRAHLDLPLRNCTVELEGVPVVDAGKVVQ